MKDLVLEHVEKRYGDKVVLRDFSARFPGGECTCIMGPSGCGKTTLLRLILGLETPDGGQILGRSFPMAAVFQENRLFEDFSALSNVTAVCPRERRPEAGRHLVALGVGGGLHAPVQVGAADGHDLFQRALDPVENASNQSRSKLCAQRRQRRFHRFPRF